MVKIFITSVIFILLTLHFDSTIYTVRIGKLPDCNGFNFCSITKDNLIQKRKMKYLHILV